MIPEGSMTCAGVFFILLVKINIETFLYKITGILYRKTSRNFYGKILYF
jgi:hypothetical protein